MPDDDPIVFRLWVQWLFTSAIASPTSNELVKAWILGDKLGCPIFQNTIMMGLLEYYSPGKGNRMVELMRVAYEGSAPGSKLRKWAVNLFIFETRKNQDGTLSTMEQNLSWIRETKDIEDFSQDYMEARVGCFREGEPVNLVLNATQYLENTNSRAR